MNPFDYIPLLVAILVMVWLCCTVVTCVTKNMNAIVIAFILTLILLLFGFITIPSTVLK